MQIANRWGSDRVFYGEYNDKIEFKQPMFIWLASLMQAWNYMPEIWWVSVTFNVLQLQAKRQAKHEISFTFAFWCVFMEGFAHKEPVFLLLGKSITAFDAYTIFDFESRQNWGFSTVARKISFFRTKCDSFFNGLAHYGFSYQKWNFMETAANFTCLIHTIWMLVNNAISFNNFKSMQRHEISKMTLYLKMRIV